MPIPVVKYAGTTKKEIVENEDYGNRCLITVAYKILEKLDTENRTFTKLEYYGRKHEEMFDTESMKEAVINAICHNDYSYGGSPIIEIYTDRIEITSAGGLPTELSKQDFLNGVVYRRNKELFKLKENPFEYETNSKQINDKINDKEKQILNVLMDNPNSTIPEISKITKISTATISRYLKQLQDKNIIERVGSNKSGYWKVLK